MGRRAVGFLLSALHKNGALKAYMDNRKMLTPSCNIYVDREKYVGGNIQLHSLFKIAHAYAFVGYKEYGLSDSTCLSKSLIYQFISYEVSFHWNVTQEGYEYWCNLWQTFGGDDISRYKKYFDRIEQLPPETVLLNMAPYEVVRTASQLQSVDKHINDGE